MRVAFEAGQRNAPVKFLPEAAAVIATARKLVKHRGSMQSYYDLEDVLISALDALDAAQGKEPADVPDEAVTSNEEQ